MLAHVDIFLTSKFYLRQCFEAPTFNYEEGWLIWQLTFRENYAFFRLSKREKLTLFFSTCEFTTDAQSFLNLFEHFRLFQFVLVYFASYLLIYVCLYMR